MDSHVDVLTAEAFASSVYSRDDNTPQGILLVDAETRNDSLHERRELIIPPTPVELVVMMLGTVGVGKTTLHKLLQGIIGGGKQSWSSDTKNVLITSARYNDFIIKFFDVEGAVGNPKVDVFLLRRVINKINEESNFVHRILWVMTPDRLQVAQRDFLQMIINGVSEEALSIVHVIITHADDLVVKEDFRREVAHHLRFLGDTEEAVLRRVTFMDLVVPETFREGSAARAEIEERWCEYQKKLLGIITNEQERSASENICENPNNDSSIVSSENRALPKRVRLERFFRHSYPARLAKVFWMEIVMFLLLCFALYYMYQYMHYFALFLVYSEEAEECMRRNAVLDRMLNIYNANNPKVNNPIFYKLIDFIKSKFQK